MRESVSIERLKELLDYDPETGGFRWRVKRNNRVPAGSTAGGPKTFGYLQIEIDGKQYTGHRLAWAMTYGEWPTMQIDHKDADPANNRLENLRLATGTQNNANARLRPDNKTGFKGVTTNPRGKRWRACIRKNGHLHYLGSFDAPEKAHAVYAAAAEKFFGEFSRVR
jgi:hypothetical protein